MLLQKRAHDKKNTIADGSKRHQDKDCGDYLHEGHLWHIRPVGFPKPGQRFFHGAELEYNVYKICVLRLRERKWQKKEQDRIIKDGIIII
jgi:hypothetical protein